MPDEAAKISPDAREAISQELSRRAGRPINWSDIQFARERASRTQRAVYVELDRKSLGDLGQDPCSDRVHFVFWLTAREGAWALLGYSGPSAAERPARSHARAYLGGGYGPDGLHAGGFVDGAGAAVAKAEIRSGGVRIVEDVPQHGVALFVIDEPVTAPVSVTLFAADGAEQVTHSVLPG